MKNEEEREAERRWTRKQSGRLRAYRDPSAQGRSNLPKERPEPCQSPFGGICR